MDEKPQSEFVEKSGPGESTDTTQRVSHLTYQQLLSHATSLGSKVDNLWQRVIYVHLGMVAAVLFLAQAEQPYLIARIVVLVFYTFNIFITFWNMREAYNGLSHAVTDMCRFPACTNGGMTDLWIRKQNYKRNILVRAVALILFWIPVTYLLMAPAFSFAGLPDMGAIDSLLPPPTN